MNSLYRLVVCILGWKSILLYADVFEEFTGLTNQEAYSRIYLERIMKPIPGSPLANYGSDQRIDMLPVIQKYVKALPLGVHVFDVGAGSGDVVNFALSLAPFGTTVHVEEPNPLLVREYLAKLERASHLQKGTIYIGPLQDYYQENGRVSLPGDPQNLILALHMIYHLTDFTEKTIDPTKDLLDAISCLYEKLAPGGSIIIVYADLFPYPEKRALCSLAASFFEKIYQARYAENLLKIYSARNALLGPNGSIAKKLTELFPQTQAELYSELHDTHFFGRSLDDLAVLAMATELCAADKERFDLRKLEFCLQAVRERPDIFNIQKETQDIPQKGFWRADEPQVIAVITKTAIDGIRIL